MTRPGHMTAQPVFETRNADIWADPTLVHQYAGRRRLQPGEEYLFSRHVPADCRILDLGVGTGRTTAYLRERARCYVGVDYSQPMVTACRLAFPGADIRQGDAQDLSSFGSGSFDVVVFAYNGLDYLYPHAARHRCLQEVGRVLAPGGRFIFSSHNSLCVFPDLDWRGWSLETARHMYWVLRRPGAGRRVRHVVGALCSTGSRYVIDGSRPRHTGARGLVTHCTTERSVRAELARFGFTVVEVHALTPRWLRALTVPWVYYCFERA